MTGAYMFFRITIKRGLEWVDTFHERHVDHAWNSYENTYLHDEQEGTTILLVDCAASEHEIRQVEFARKLVLVK